MNIRRTSRSYVRREAPAARALSQALFMLSGARLLSEAHARRPIPNPLRIHAHARLTHPAFSDWLVRTAAGRFGD